MRRHVLLEIPDMKFY